MESLDFLVLGNASCHYILKVDRIPDEDTTIYIQNENFDELFFGGTGLNIAYSLAKVTPCAMELLTTTDEKYGSNAVKKLQEVGICTDHILLTEGKATAYIIEDEAKRRLTILGGEFKRLSACQMPDELFRKARLAVFTMDTYENVMAFMDALERNNTPFAFCMRSDRTIFHDELLRRALPKAKLLFCNAFEQTLIQEVLGLEHIRQLFDLGSTERIAVTQGGDGIRLYERGREAETFIPITRTEAVRDCTGAGDGFVAGYLSGYARGLAPTECAKLGATLSAFIIEQIGCINGSPTAEALFARYRQRPDVE